MKQHHPFGLYHDYSHTISAQNNPGVSLALDLIRYRTKPRRCTEPPIWLTYSVKSTNIIHPRDNPSRRISARLIRRFFTAYTRLDPPGSMPTYRPICQLAALGQYFKASLGEFPVIAVRFFTDSSAMRMQAENGGLSLSRWSPSAYLHLL